MQAVRDILSTGPHHFRLYSSGIFGDIHSDSAVSAGLELLLMELDLDLRTWLATALVDQFSTEAIDAARTVLVEDHPDSYDLKSSLVVACKLMDLRRSRIAAVGTRTCRTKTTLCQQRITASGLR